MKRSCIASKQLKAVLLLSAIAVILYALSSQSVVTQAEPVEKKPVLPGDVAAVINNHCIACHGPEKQKGNVRLDTLDPDFVNGVNAEDWHDVLNVLNLGDMPPKGQPPLPDPSRRALVGWITGELKQAKESKSSTGGQAVLRRLTRYEYNNTMADLLGIEMDYAQSLPPDSKSKEGFENNGQALGISPIQMEYYLKAARLGLSKAIVEGDQPEVVRELITKSQKPFKKSAYTAQENGRVMPGQAFIGRTLLFPREGVIRIRVTVEGIEVPKDQGYPRLVLQVGHRADTISPEATFAQADVVPTPEGEPITLEFTGRIEEMPLPGHNPKFPGILITVANAYEAGPGYQALKRKQADAQRRLRKYERAKAKAEKQGKPAPEPPLIQEIELPEMPSFVVKSIEFEGPVVDAWPPSQHTRILFDKPDAMTEQDYAKAVIKRFGGRAYRRPVTEVDVDRVYDFYKSIRPKMPSFESAIRESLAMVLISPEFLYMFEPKPEQADSRRLTDHELAVRLSYFLWSTMPDDTLRAAADKGLLSNPKEFDKQVRRMIRDPRTEAFVRHFTSQWLDLPGVDRVAVNPQYYPDFNDSLKPYMKQETVRFMGEILRRDLSALNLIDSDFVMVNRPLANHYGLYGPKGIAFERVLLEDGDHRGGLLTQASVLLMNSNGEDSHPIRRAVWLRTRLLDDPPAPPPPDVPDLDTEDPKSASLSLKRQLELHRQKPSCMDCHVGLDPWGIPLENYDAVGRYREEVSRLVGKKFVKSPVVADTVLPGGQQVSDVDGLKAAIKTDRRDHFVRGLVRYMLAYSLGRSLDYTDRDDVDALVKQFDDSGQQLDELMLAITKSNAFNTK